MRLDAISSRWGSFKSSMQHYWSKLAKRDNPTPPHIDNYHYESHRIDQYPTEYKVEQDRDASHLIDAGIYDEDEYSVNRSRKSSGQPESGVEYH